MSVIFSKSCEYATQSVLYMARKGGGEPILLRDISDNLHIPYHFLSKVLQQLTRDGVIVSHKGANGGFMLGRPANEITLGDITKAVDGDTFLDACVLGFPECGDHNPCPVHDHWKKAKGILLQMLNDSNIEQLSKNLDGKLEMLELLRRK